MASKVLFITSSVMGRGDDQLGELLMANLLRLVCEGSSFLGHVRELEEQGVEMLACTSCLEYFDLTDKLMVGKPTTMAKSIQSMMTADVVTL